MKRLVIICCMSALSTLSAIAKEGAGNIKNLITFTTQSTVKLEVAFQTLPATSAKYQVKITGKNGELYSASIAPSAVIQDQQKLVFNIKDLHPQLWYPANPVLYQLSFIAAGEEKKQNIGFRFIESKNGNIYLNGKPIFLRGIAINPPDRGIPDSIEKSRKFAEAYVSFMKSIHVNIIRIPNDDTWYDVCDELGMMVFGGNYSGAVDGQKPPTDYEKAIRWYQNDAYGMIAHHPSLMIYAMTNETPFNGSTVAQWEKFLSYAADKLKTWDSTRLYIANAGYGYGKAGDICDLHRYWGWYYSSPFTFLHIRNNEDIIPFKKKVQPVTFTECVGNYSGPDGRYNLTPDHKNPGSQLNWTGHASNDVQAQLANEHQSFTFKQATEMFRRLRVVNPELSGVFPFTILFYNWHTVQQFIDMDPKPVTQQAKLSYSPVLVSWENWTTQAYAGATIKPTLHIVNDDDNFSDLDNAKFVCQVLDETKNAVYADTFALPHIAYYSTYQKQLSITLPAYLINGNYQLSGKILKGNTLVSENFDKLYIAGNSITSSAVKAKQAILLYDPAGKTAASFNKLGIAFKAISSFKNIAANSVIVIGENGVDNNLVKEADAVKQFVNTGGRILALRQDSVHFPAMNNILNCPLKNVTMDLDIAYYPPPPRPSRNGYYVNPERPDHPIFSGIKRENLRVWSDYTNWNESNKTGFPAIYPVTDGFVPQNKKDIENIAVLGNYGVALEGITIAEMFNGKGSIVLCGLDLANRTSLDPIADRLLLNLVSYTGDGKEHNNYQLVTEPIIWGDYGSEKGLLTGVNSGLLLNARPRLTGAYSKAKLILTKEGHMLGGQSGGFNTRPGVQYVAYGRRPFGPYSLRGFGNVPDPDSENNNIGEGSFWCTVPAEKTKAVTTVWNPHTEPLTIKAIVNGKEASATIKGGETATVTCPVSATTIQMSFSGDRRLVILQTAFE